MTSFASVIIPTLNGAKRIGPTLEALVSQCIDKKLFEVIIIDNNSTHDKYRVTEKHAGVCALRDAAIECRVVTEPRTGLSYARIKGILEARSEFVCFLDDDNVPEADYISNGISLFTDPSVGVLVSRVYPRYECDPKKSMRRREHLFAINHRLGDSVIEWGSDTEFAPTIGAGMWVRRSAFLRAVPYTEPERLLADRKGKSLTSGGDIELGYLIGKAGYKRVYSPKLRLLHLIPQSRLTSKYFCKLIVGIIRSQKTIEVRYSQTNFGLRHRLISLLELLAAAALSPILMLRRDGLREVLFILASRWARFEGPYKTLT